MLVIVCQAFLDILKELKKSVDEVSLEAVVEFLRYGHLFRR